jgi:hypothetical protein
MCAAMMVAAKEGDVRALTELFLRAVVEGRIECIRMLLEMEWESVAGVGVLQSALTRFCIHRALVRSLVVTSNSTVALYHPKYMRRICKFLRCPGIDVSLLEEVRLLALVHARVHTGVYK